MPVYLVHGFRWAREGMTGIRVRVIIHNLEDVAVEYIQNKQSTAVLLEHFRKEFPSQMQLLEDPATGRGIHLLEQYNPEDENSDVAVTKPFAFVADRVITIAARPGNVADIIGGSRPASETSQRPDPAVETTTTSTSSSPAPRHNPTALSLNLDEAISVGPGGTPQAWEALAQIRDAIAEGEKIGWWIVYNGDPERAFDDDEDEGDYDSDQAEDENALSDEAEAEGTRTPTQATPVLERPLPSLLPDNFVPLPNKPAVEPDASAEKDIGTAIPHPPPATSSKTGLPTEEKSPGRPKSSRSFVNPLSIRRKSSKSTLQTQKEDIPEPPKLKEISKKEGFRQKFFGRGVDKK